MKAKYKKFDSLLKPIPFLIKGKDASRLYKDIQKDDKFFQKYLGFLEYVEYSNEIRGSSPLRTGQINKIVANSGLRVAVPGDDVNREVYNLIKGGFYAYIDFNALSVYADMPLNKKNTSLWNKVTELAEEKQGRVKFPFMIQGFYIIPDGNHEKIIPASNFKIIEDERLSEKYNEWRFDHIDNYGIPNDLKKEKGFRVLRTRKDGLSRVFLNQKSVFSNKNPELNLSDDNLFVSNDRGRIVLVRDAKKPKKDKGKLERILKLNNF